MNDKDLFSLLEVAVGGLAIGIGLVIGVTVARWLRDLIDRNGKGKP